MDHIHHRISSINFDGFLEFFFITIHSRPTQITNTQMLEMS